MSKKIIISICILCFISLTFVSTVFAEKGAIYGWMWSQDSGWLRMSSCEGYSVATDTNTNCDTGVQYGVTANVDKTLSGYAWSTNIGWISFGPNTCPGATAPNVVYEKDALGLFKIKLQGVAQAVSPTQTGWNTPDKNGGWNGCIYLDKASMPTNACVSDFGAVFVRSAIANEFTGSGWWFGTKGNINNINCTVTNPLYLGMFTIDGIATAYKAKFVSTNTEPEIITLQPQSWDAVCAPGKQVTLNWTTVNTTECHWTSGAIGPAQLNGSQTFTVNKTGPLNFTLQCSNSKSGLSVQKSTIIGCTECSDGIDNDVATNPSSGIDQFDQSCHSQCKKVDPTNEMTDYDPARNNESLDCKLVNKKGFPNFKEL